MKRRAVMILLGLGVAVSPLAACGGSSGGTTPSATTSVARSSFDGAAAEPTNAGAKRTASRAYRSSLPPSPTSAPFEAFPNADPDAKNSVANLTCPVVQESLVSEAIGTTMYLETDPDDAGSGGIFGCHYTDAYFAPGGNAPTAPGVAPELPDPTMSVNFGAMPVSMKALRSAAASVKQPGATTTSVPEMPGAIESFGKSVYGGGSLLEPGCGVTVALGESATATVNVVQTGGNTKHLCSVAKVLMVQWSKSAR